MKNIIPGQNVIANFGAMYPTYEYTISEVVGQKVHLMNDEEEVVVEMKVIRQPGERSGNGSPIGYNLV